MTTPILITRGGLPVTSDRLYHATMLEVVPFMDRDRMPCVLVWDSAADEGYVVGHDGGVWGWIGRPDHYWPTFTAMAKETGFVWP